MRAIAKAVCMTSLLWAACDSSLPIGSTDLAGCLITGTCPDLAGCAARGTCPVPDLAVAGGDAATAGDAGGCPAFIQSGTACSDVGQICPQPPPNSYYCCTQHGTGPGTTFWDLCTPPIPCMSAGGQCLMFSVSVCAGGRIGDPSEYSCGIPSTVCCLPLGTGGMCTANPGSCVKNSDCCSDNCVTRGAPTGFCCVPGGCP